MHPFGYAPGPLQPTPVSCICVSQTQTSTRDRGALPLKPAVRLSSPPQRTGRIDELTRSRERGGTLRIRSLVAAASLCVPVGVRTGVVSCQSGEDHGAGRSSASSIVASRSPISSSRRVTSTSDCAVLAARVFPVWGRARRGGAVLD